jgi:hypothetical protein
MMAHPFLGDKRPSCHAGSVPYDFGVDYTDISERISTLMQEIRDIREMNARYWEVNVQTQAERAAHAAREIRLLQIKEELSRMMDRSQQKATLRWQLGEKP